MNQDPSAAAFLRVLDPAPPRVWSLIMSVFGDCVLPRGTAMPLALLTEILAALGVENSAVRAATSRLTRDGLLTRQRDGRLSLYTLTDHALALSRAAEAVIYAAAPPTAPPGWQLALMTQRSAAARAALHAGGFRQVTPNVLARPAQQMTPDVDDVMLLNVDGGTAELAAAAFPLGDIAKAFEAFETHLALLQDPLPNSPDEALIRRIALVHAFRRVALREPALAPCDVPQPWPGKSARLAFLHVHRLLSAVADPLLDRELGTVTRARTKGVM